MSSLLTWCLFLINQQLFKDTMINDSHIKGPTPTIFKPDKILPAPTNGKVQTTPSCEICVWVPQDFNSTAVLYSVP